VIGREGKIQVIVDGAAGQDPLPGFRPILEVAAIGAAGFVQGDDPVQGVVQLDGVRLRAMEIEDGNVTIEPRDGGGRRREALGDEVLLWEHRFRICDRGDDQIVPFFCESTAFVRLVANLEIEIVEMV